MAAERVRATRTIGLEQEQARQICEVLGLDPNKVAELHIAPGTVDVTEWETIGSSGAQ